MATRSRVSIERVKQRFNKKYVINEESGCWEWTASLNNIGYGMFRWAKGKMRTAHRVSYELFNGSIPENLIVCHTCDNRKCVNPAHLSVGSRKDKFDDMVAKGTARLGIAGYPKKKCIHCGVEMSFNMLARYHNDNCKHKP